MITIPGKIPIRIYPFFWIIVIFIGGINSDFSPLGMLIWALIILISVTVHEFGHALTAIFFGQTAQIELVGFGGVTHRAGGRLKFWQDFLVVLNGPLAGLALAFGSYFLLYALGNQAPKILLYTLSISFYANLFWTVVNLLPVQPLDGGHLLRIFLESILGLRGIKISLFISFLVSLVISLFFFYLQFFLAGAFFLMFTFESFRNWQSSLMMSEHDDNIHIQNELKEAENEYRNGQTESALEKLKVIRNNSKAGLIYQSASQMMAQIFNEEGKYQEAYEVLAPFKSKLDPDALILKHQLAYRLGHWREATELGNITYQHQPSYEIALINALSYGALGEAKPAVGWLKCALKDGLPNLKDILRHVQFDKIRSDPLFEKMKNEA